MWKIRVELFVLVDFPRAMIFKLNFVLLTRLQKKKKNNKNVCNILKTFVKVVLRKFDNFNFYVTMNWATLLISWTLTLEVTYDLDIFLSTWLDELGKPVNLFRLGYIFLG